ncbi:MAG: universal stress protein [Prochlorothrix sp.]|nr:universal stress protein [Prochlorothrix sp.]
MTSSYQRILTAIDRSAQASAIFAQSCALAQQTQAQWQIAHCIPGSQQEDRIAQASAMELDLSLMLWESQQQQHHHQEAEAQHWLQEYGQQAKALDLHPHLCTGLGNPGPWLCQLAQDWQADLIIIGRRGHQTVQELLFGSVSSYVVHHAPCCVLVVQGTQTVGETASLATAAAGSACA